MQLQVLTTVTAEHHSALSSGQFSFFLTLKNDSTTNAVVSIFVSQANFCHSYISLGQVLHNKFLGITEAWLFTGTGKGCRAPPGA